MLPVVALVGRPNVGKSTLFNRLTRTRDALVADYPGLTRDRRYGVARLDGRSCIVIDTGGLGATGSAELAALVARQVDVAVEEADVVVLVVDHQSGLTEQDADIARRLRAAGKRVVVAVNKAEGVAPELAEAEFHRLGFRELHGIAALHGHGVARLMEAALEPFSPAQEEPAADDALAGLPKLAVVGRPNVGKSTLVNRLVGADRLVTSEEPGTTRDSILVPCERDGRRFVLIDTAGIRRRARVSDAVEKFSVVQSLQSIEDAGAVIVLLDAREGVTEQDLHLIGLVEERGRALAIGVNKWDGLPVARRVEVERQIERKLDFVPYATVHYVSALHGSGVAELVRAALDAHESAGRHLPTPRLNQVLADAITAHAPPVSRGRRVQLRYAHQGGRFPPVIVVHGTQAERLPAHYRRYLENAFREAFGLVGTPVRVELRSGENPFAGKRNRLTPRQAKRKRRLIRHDRSRRR
ncbi:MAG TPA: ribosome biogenesis GTPase Der [Gammaproteobacteria bacterium]